MGSGSRRATRVEAALDAFAQAARSRQAGILRCTGSALGPSPARRLAASADVNPRRPVTRSTALMNTPRRRRHRCSRLLATPVMDRRACRAGWRRVQQTAIATASEHKIAASTTAAIHNAMTSAAPIPLLNLRDGVSTTLDSAGRTSTRARRKSRINGVKACLPACDDENRREQIRESSAAVRRRLRESE